MSEGTFPTADITAFRAYAMANPGKVNNATNGPGSTVHLMGEIVARGLEVKLQHVHYRGAAPAMNDMLERYHRQQCGGADELGAKPQGGHVSRAGRVVGTAPAAATGRADVQGIGLFPALSVKRGSRYSRRAGTPTARAGQKRRFNHTRSEHARFAKRMEAIGNVPWAMTPAKTWCPRGE